MSTPETGPQHHGEDEWLRTELAELDGDVPQLTNDDDANSLLAMYQQLPERKMELSLGADIRIEFGPEETDMHLMPLTVFGTGVIATDRAVPRAKQQPRLYYLNGSIFAAQTESLPYALSKLRELAVPLINSGTNGYGSNDNGLTAVYSPGRFCRDAHLAYVRVHTLQSLRQTEVRQRSVIKPLGGAIITATLKPDQQQQLFVESDAKFSPPIRNVQEKVYGAYIPLLSYDYDES